MVGNMFIFKCTHSNEMYLKLNNHKEQIIPKKSVDRVFSGLSRVSTKILLERHFCWFFKIQMFQPTFPSNNINIVWIHSSLFYVHCPHPVSVQ